ncbi:hypothetical protein ABC304_17800 [Microbacterium sp. 1P10UB]|uniref:hypothetical protein n=1 Tax=unclassified Microbacterium TaxID=2609290 RepID=UPI00399F92DF
MTKPSKIDFRIHAIDAGSDDGGRVVFHRMLSALVGVEYPTATDIRADPGDWGMDVMAGSLVDSILIWQSKYFYDKIGDSQKRQIRESFASAMAHAVKHGYRVDAWTLCVACEVSAPEKKWWDTKVREWSKEHPHVQFDLWDAPRLRRKLISPDADPVWAEFYGPDKDHAHARQGVPTLLPPALSQEETPSYESALFVKQMLAAGITAMDSQRHAHFNADLLVRDITARSVPDQLAAVAEMDAALLGTWEDAVADPATSPSADDYEPSARRLFASVMKDIRTVAPPAELPLRAAHTRGLMHRIVEEARAGWVHDWQDVATNARSGTTSSEAGL